jgi:hypothetical protein
MEYFDAVIKEWEAFEKKGYHDFYDGGYEALFKSYSQGVLNNKESLWEIAFYHSQGRRNGGAWGIYNGPQVAEPTGVSASESSQYMGRANGFFIVVPEWRNFFEASDKRRDVAICTYRYTWNGTKKEHVKEERSAGSWYVGKWRREWMPKESWNKNINYADVNYCPLRYADVVLMAAEAYNETGTDRQKAWDLLNSVRTRAEATSITEANYDEMMSARKKTHNLTFIDDSTPEGKFRTALYWERGFELACSFRFGETVAVIVNKQTGVVTIMDEQNNEYSTAPTDISLVSAVYPAFASSTQFVSRMHINFGQEPFLINTDDTVKKGYYTTK